MASIDIPNACSTSRNEQVGTTSLEALSCNLGHIDRVVNSSELTAPNRLGVVSDTLRGALNKLGVLFDNPIRNITPGLEISDLRAHRYPADTGDIYIPTAPLPFTTGASGSEFDSDDWVLLQGLTSQDLINDVSQEYIFPTVAAYKAFSTAFPVGKKIYLTDRKARFTIISGTSTANETSIIASTGLSQSASLIHDETTTIDSYGAQGTVDESSIFQDYSDWATAQTGITEMRLGRNKVYTCTNVIITSNTALNLNGSTVMQVPDSSTAIFRNVSTSDVHTEDNIFFFNGILNGNASNYTQDMQNFLITIISVHNFGVFDIVFEDQRSINVGGGTSIALRISGTSSFYNIDRCKFFRLGTTSANGNGIFAQGSYATISNCISNQVWDAPFNFERMTHGVMTNNVATNSGVAFAVTLESENITLSNNTSVTSTTSGFLVDKFTAAGGTLMKNIVLTGNVSKNSGTNGVGNNYRVVDSDQVTLTGNIGDTSDDSNFEVFNSSNITIDGGQATNSTTKYGVLLQDCTDVNLTGIDIYNQFSYGVFSRDCSGVVIDGNKIHDTGEHQIRVSGGFFNTIKGNEIYDIKVAAQRAVFTDAAPDNLTVVNNNIYDTRVTPLQRGALFDSTVTNGFYRGNTLHNLVVGNCLTDNATNVLGYAKIGPTSGRPTGLCDGGDDIGQLYFDTTLAAAGKPIWWIGSGWVDGLGASV